jgi:hypothetical protein
MAMLSVLIGLMPAECPAQDKNDDPDQVYVFGTTVVIPSGLKGTIYYIHSAKKLNELQKEKPRGTIYTSSLNIPTQDYSLGFPGISKRLEWFAIDYTGKFWIGKPGEYRWELTSDDGSMLFIDDKPVIDNARAACCGHADGTDAVKWRDSYDSRALFSGH